MTTTMVFSKATAREKRMTSLKMTLLRRRTLLRKTTLLRIALGMTTMSR